MWMQLPLQGRFTFDEAPQAAKNLNDTGGFAGYHNWRMPKKSELASLIVEDCCPSICQEAFPNTPSTRFWTSTPNKAGNTDAWNVNFLIGSVSSNFRIYPNAVRLVRKIYKPNNLITAPDSYELTNILKEGSMMQGTVKNITTYGVFIEIKPGIQGLVHISEMDLTNTNIKPSEILAVGNQVDVIILRIDKDKNRISLSMRKCKLNP